MLFNPANKERCAAGIIQESEGPRRQLSDILPLKKMPQGDAVHRAQSCTGSRPRALQPVSLQK